MITAEEIEQIGFIKQEHSEAHSLVVDDFSIWFADGKLTLCEWFRGEDINISHLNISQIKDLIALLKKPKCNTPNETTRNSHNTHD